MTENNDYRPLSLMLVEYKDGDLIGFIMAWISMLPILYIIGLFTVVLTRRDLTTIFYFIGCILCELTNSALKHTIQQPRPVQSSKRSGKFSKYGMPSDHSQMMFFCSSFFILLIVFRFYWKTFNRLNQMIGQSLLITIATVSAVLVAYSRIYLEYHTVDQVLVGALIGTIMGCIWFFLVHNVFEPYFYQITTWKISETLMIRDYSHIPNVLLFQYTVERNEANIRRKTKMN